MAGGFDSLGIMPELIRAVDELGWLLPTDVQDEAIPLILGGGDVMVAAETGSGKTAAFALPMIQCVYEILRSSVQVAHRRNPANVLTTITINQNDKDSIFSVESDGVSCQSSGEINWVGARTTHGIREGKAYFEFEVKGGDFCRVGWSTKIGNLELGRDEYGFGYGSTGKKSHGNKFDDYGGAYRKDDIIGCCIDLDKGLVHYIKNGIDLGNAFVIPLNIRQATFFPTITFKNSSGKLSFTQQSCKYTPAEYIPMASSPAGALVSSDSPEAILLKGHRAPLAIIIEPSRELAEQVFQDISNFTKYLSSPCLSVALLVGGDDKKSQQKLVAQGVDIVVVTVGKALDFLQKGWLALSQIRFFILDEADRLVDSEDGRSSVMKLFAACPSGGSGSQRLQVCFFSATLHSPDITTLAGKICDFPVWVDLRGKEGDVGGSDSLVPASVHHVVFRLRADAESDAEYARRAQTPISASEFTDGVHASVSVGVGAGVGVDKGRAILGGREEVSERIKRNKLRVLLAIINEYQMSQCMIFCRTNVDCDNLEAFLCAVGGGSKFHKRKETGRQNPYSCAVLAGKRSMNQRRDSLEAFKQGEVRFLICTDLGARGIDVKGLPFVINMTLPDQIDNYIHRIGRVGRADRVGLAISIVAAEGAEEKVWWHMCPSKGAGCGDRRLVDDGGCTKWVMESEVLRDIEDRIRQHIQVLTSDFHLPVELSAMDVVYGEGRVPDVAVKAEESSLRSREVKLNVEQLAAMELIAQNNFLLNKRRFGVFS